VVPKIYSVCNRSRQLLVSSSSLRAALTFLLNYFSNTIHLLTNRSYGAVYVVLCSCDFDNPLSIYFQFCRCMQNIYLFMYLFWTLKKLPLSVNVVSKVTLQLQITYTMNIEKCYKPKCFFLREGRRNIRVSGQYIRYLREVKTSYLFS